MTTLAELEAQLAARARQRFARQAGKPLVYVALGASDAVGVGATTAQGGYVELLAARLRRYYQPERSVAVYNLAVSGYTIGEIARDELPRLPGLAPDLITLWAGANDVVQSVDGEEFSDQLTRILAVAQRSGAATFVGTVPDLSLVPLIRAFPPWLMPMGDPVAYARRRSRELADVVLRLGPAYGAHLVHLPMGEILSDPGLVAADGFHPSDAGHARLADAWWTEIRKALL